MSGHVFSRAEPCKTTRALAPAFWITEERAFCKSGTKKYRGCPSRVSNHARLGAPGKDQRARSAYGKPSLIAPRTTESRPCGTAHHSPARSALFRAECWVRRHFDPEPLGAAHRDEGVSPSSAAKQKARSSSGTRFHHATVTKYHLMMFLPNPNFVPTENRTLFRGPSNTFEKKL